MVITPIAIPFLQDENGMMIVTIFVGEQREKMNVAIDTGSSHLIANYKTEEDQSNVSRQQEILSFGTQTNKVLWEVKKCTFTGININNDATHPVSFTHCMRIGRVVHTNGQTNYNVLGLGRSNSTNDVLTTLNVKCFSIRWLYGEGWLVLYDTPTVINRVPLLRLDNFPFYTLRALNVFVENTKLACNIDIIIDVGSNYTTLPCSIYKTCVQYLSKRDKKTDQIDDDNLCFRFQFMSTSMIELQFGKNVFLHNNSFLFDSASSDVDHIVLGSIFLRNMDVQFGTSYISFTV